MLPGSRWWSSGRGFSQKRHRHVRPVTSEKKTLKNFGMLNFALQDPAGTNVDVLQPIALIPDFWSLKCDTVTARRLFHHFSFFSVSLLVDWANLLPHIKSHDAVLMLSSNQALTWWWCHWSNQAEVEASSPSSGGWGFLWWLWSSFR